MRRGQVVVDALIFRIIFLTMKNNLLRLKIMKRIKISEIFECVADNIRHSQPTKMFTKFTETTLILHIFVFRLFIFLVNMRMANNILSNLLHFFFDEQSMKQRPVLFIYFDDAEKRIQIRLIVCQFITTTNWFTSQRLW